MLLGDIMRLSIVTLSLTLMAFAAVAAVTPSTLFAQQNATQQCQQLLTGSENSQAKKECELAAEEVTWGDWLKGHSRSVQFHFFDLIELFSSSSDAQKEHYKNNYSR